MTLTRCSPNRSRASFRFSTATGLSSFAWLSACCSAWWIWVFAVRNGPLRASSALVRNSASLSSAGPSWLQASRAWSSDWARPASSVRARAPSIALAAAGYAAEGAKAIEGGTDLVGFLRQHHMLLFDQRAAQRQQRLVGRGRDGEGAVD